MGQIFCNDEEVVVDTTDMIVAVLFLCLIVLNILGTSYDVIFTTGKASEGIRALHCFSIRRNFIKLAKDPFKECEPRRQQTKGLNGLRTIIITMVIFAHSLASSIFLANPHYLEKMYRSPFAVIIPNGNLIMQGFFIMSALLLVYNYCIYVEKHGHSWVMVLKGTLLRWLRLTPAYAVVLAFTATWMRHLSSGPLWNLFVNVEVKDCRRHWWRHLSYINNYFEYSQCMIQSWYLAADMQLFLVGLFVVVFCQSKRSRIVTLSTLSVIGFITPAIHTYYQDLDGVLMMTPETARNSFILDNTFNHVYKRGHTNLLSTTIGLAVGYILYYWNDFGIDVNKYKKLRPLYWCSFPALVAIVYSGSIFYGDRPRLPVLFRAAYSALVKPVFGAMLVVFMLGVILRYENVYRSILEWNGWTIPSKLCYSAYLLHVIFVRFYIGIQNTIVEGSLVYQINSFIGLLAVTFVSAIPFWVLVESPLGDLVKNLMTPQTHNDEEKCETNSGKIEIRL